MTALAADIGRSVAANLGGSAGGATATCVWREADPAKFNLLTLAESCEATRLRRLGRGLQQAGFGVTLELAGDAAALAGSDPAALAGALEGSVGIASSLSTTGQVNGIASGAVVVVSDATPTTGPTAAPTAALVRVRVPVPVPVNVPVPVLVHVPVPVPVPSIAAPTAAPTGLSLVISLRACFILRENSDRIECLLSFFWKLLSFSNLDRW